MAKKPTTERRDWRQEVTDTIVEMLERGTAPWQKEWSDKAAAQSMRMPHNAVTGRPYTGGNALYLLAKGAALDYDDPRWMTYNQSQEKGWQVKKGEKGTQVEFWQFDRVEKVKGPDGKMREERVKLDPPMQRLYTVFNAQQMDGVPALQPLKREDWQISEQAERILQNSGAKIRHEGTRAYYSMNSDGITMPPKASFGSDVGYYSTALHELGHWTGHESRLNREGIAKFDRFGSPQYAKEELRAEMASVFLQAEIGLPHNTENHASYLGNWLEVLKKDKNELFRAARDASKIADYVLALDREKEMANELDEKAQDRSQPLEGLPGYQARYNNEPGMAGVEVVTANGKVISFGGRPALEDFISKHSLTIEDAQLLRGVDARADAHRNMPAYPEFSANTKEELQANNVPQRGTPAYAAMVRQSIHDRNASGDYHELHAAVRERMGENVSFGMLASDGPIKGKVIAETQHSIALDIAPGQAVALYKMNLQALPKPGQQVTIGPPTEQGREVLLDRMIEQAHDQTQARHGAYNSTALRPEESQALMQGAEQWEVQKQAEKLNPDDKAKLIAKSNTQTAAATAKKQELDSAPRERNYIENVADHISIAKDFSKPGAVVGLPEIGAVAYVDKSSGDLTLKAPTAAALHALQEKTVLPDTVKVNSIPTKSDSMIFDNSTGDAGGLAAESLRRMGASRENIDKVMRLTMSQKEQQEKIKNSMEILQYDARELLGDNAKAHAAQKAEGIYKGAIVGETTYHVMQQVSATQAVAHEKTVFNGQVPRQGQHVQVKYDQGRASANEVAPARPRSKEKSMGL